MTATVIDSDMAEQLEISGIANSWTIKKGVDLTSPTHGIVELAMSSDNDIIVNGTIHSLGAMYYSIYVQGDNDRITIGRTGEVHGFYGLAMFGDAQQGVNYGLIDTSSYAVGIFGKMASFSNYGTIRSDNYGLFSNGLDELSYRNEGKVISHNGLNFDASSAKVFLSAESIVRANVDAITIGSSLPTDVAVLRNNGLVAATNGLAISAGNGSERIVNHGTIKGAIDLGGGDDIFDNRHGTIDHAIVGGDGHDKYLLDSRETIIEEAAGGYDRMHVNFSTRIADNVEELYLVGKSDLRAVGNADQNYLGGNRGDNRLMARGGDDALFGGRGDDVLTGGAGSDAFYFKDNADREIITDFVDGIDKLVFISDKFGDINNFLAHHVHQRGDDLVLSGAGTTMIIENMLKADLDTTDFVF